MPLHRFDRSSLRAMPWKNGGGTTREIACIPVGAGLDEFDWRVSIAHVASEGPFSRFEGVDRVITLLEGGGLRLYSPEDAVDHCLSTPLEPWSFDGQWAIQSELLGADCHDFNVMTRRRRCTSKVAVHRGTAHSNPAEAGVLLACQGEIEVRLGEGRCFQLNPGQGLWWHDEMMSWQVDAGSDAVLLSALIQRIAHG